MKLDFIDLGKLSVSKANMRYTKKAPDVSDIVPTVRARGVLVPLIVRPNCAPDSYEIVAGARRYHAALIVAEEAGPDADAPVQLPCAILDDGDDAAAVEASLIENVARLDPDEVQQWASFTRLVREGRSIDDIAATFGMPELGVRRILALGNLMPRIRDLYRDKEIDAATVRHLTMATKAQQRAWLALIDDPAIYAPTGRQLKAWLFGGNAIAVSHALFDVEASGLTIIADLFGEDRYFADGDAFWTHQQAAIEQKRDAFLEAGWSEVVVVPASEHFETWAHEKAAKRKGGRVYLDVRATGEVVVHEGYVTRKEARRIDAGESPSARVKAARPELTSTLATYIDLHRHAAVRAALTAHGGIALRLMVAHAIVGSPLWTVKPEPQATRSDAVRESVELSTAETDFDVKRRSVLDLLGASPDDPTVTGGNGDSLSLVAVFTRLLALPDAAIMDVITTVMGETLASGSAAVEAVGQAIGVDMAEYWQADDAFFDLIRDREVLTAIVAEVAGDTAAKANASEKSKLLKAIIHDHLKGANGRTKVAGWVPKWMAFPPAAYTARGGVGMVRAAGVVAAVHAESGPPETDDADADTSPVMAA